MFKKVLLTLLLLTWTQAQARTIRVFEIDTGVDTSHKFINEHIKDKKPIYDMNYQDLHSHGTHIAGLILRNVCPEVQLLSCNFYVAGKVNSDLFESCWKRAANENVDIVNFSAGGSSFDNGEYLAIDALNKQGAIVVVAAGNDNLELTNPQPALEHTNCRGYFPACLDLPNVIAVGALNYHQTDRYLWDNHHGSNYGKQGMVWEKGEFVYSTIPNGNFDYYTGTSQAAAIHTNRLVKAMCAKYNNN